MHYAINQQITILLPTVPRHHIWRRHYVHSQNCERRLLDSRPSVRTEQLGSHWTDFHEIWYLRILRKSVKKIQVALKSDKNIGHFTWRPIHIFFISRSFLTMRNVADKQSREKKLHYVFSTFFPENLTFYEIMLKNTVERGRPQITIWCMHIACWIPKATNTHTHTGCITLTAFQVQQRLRDDASMLR
jgi:hypothetical protein